MNPEIIYTNYRDEGLNEGTEFSIKVAGAVNYECPDKVRRTTLSLNFSKSYAI